MSHPKSRWEKGSPDTQARMAAISQKAKEAREARKAQVSTSPPTSDKPFVNAAFPAMTTDVNEFTGVTRGFPQQAFGALGEVKSLSWPGDK